MSEVHQIEDFIKNRPERVLNWVMGLFATEEELCAALATMDLVTEEGRSLMIKQQGRIEAIRSIYNSFLEMTQETPNEPNKNE